jgi:hypothetical protein
MFASDIDYVPLIDIYMGIPPVEIRPCILIHPQVVALKGPPGFQLLET